MKQHDGTWRRALRAEAPRPGELRAVEHELSRLGCEPLPAETVLRLTRAAASRAPFLRPPRRGPFRASLLLLALTCLFTSTASVGPRVHFPQSPSRLPTAPLELAFHHLADRGATRPEIQLAMGVIDRHVFQALEALKSAAATSGQLGATAVRVLEQLRLARQPTPPPTVNDVPLLIATMRNAEATTEERLAAAHALGTCIAAGVTALQAAELQEPDLRTARDFYANRLANDIGATAGRPATGPATPGSPPKEPETPPSAR